MEIEQKRKKNILIYNERVDEQILSKIHEMHEDQLNGGQDAGESRNCMRQLGFVGELIVKRSLANSPLEKKRNESIELRNSYLQQGIRPARRRMQKMQIPYNNQVYDVLYDGQQYFFEGDRSVAVQFQNDEIALQPLTSRQFQALSSQAGNSSAEVKHYEFYGKMLAFLELNGEFYWSNPDFPFNAHQSIQVRNQANESIQLGVINLQSAEFELLLQRGQQERPQPPAAPRQESTGLENKRRMAIFSREEQEKQRFAQKYQEAKQREQRELEYMNTQKQQLQREGKHGILYSESLKYLRQNEFQIREQENERLRQNAIELKKRLDLQKDEFEQEALLKKQRREEYLQRKQQYLDTKEQEYEEQRENDEKVFLTRESNISEYERLRNKEIQQKFKK